MPGLRYRQIHLDFHTSPDIDGIGADFDKAHWQRMLRLARANSITCFAKCHHGWSYHPTRVGRMHPHLNFDLLHAQYDACKEIDVNVPIYLSAGYEHVASQEHPEWRQVLSDGRYGGWMRQVVAPGFHNVCFNSPYLDYLVRQIEEVVELFPDCNGIFLDIIYQWPCCCRWCLERMAQEGLDAEKEEDRQRGAELALARYYERATAAARSRRADMPVFHNRGHISRGQRDILKYFSHLELESLPTGGWGYDHFPLSAKYCSRLGLDFLGMTGKFHTSWGEFGGYKHPNALRYECAAMLAFGARCSVGDQLHPRGRLDESTCRLIGAAYAEVETKEPWISDTANVADIGLLSSEAVHAGRPGHGDADEGASRLLLEEHFLFDVLDADMDFSQHRMLILPDNILVNEALRARLVRYMDEGGRLMLTGSSGLDPTGKHFVFDIGADHEGESPFQPDYVLASARLRPTFCDSPLLMLMKSHRIRATDGSALGEIYDPYFNRTFRHFCSHQHAPPRPQSSGYHAGVRKGNVLYLAHPVFSLYRASGAVALRQYISSVIREFLGEGASLETNLPSTARVNLCEQALYHRHILHLLYAPVVTRGAATRPSAEQFVRDTQPVELIEDLLPLRDVEVTCRLPRPVARVTLEPQGQTIPFDVKQDRVTVRLPVLSCHQMVVFHQA